MKYINFTLTIFNEVNAIKNIYAAHICDLHLFLLDNIDLW